MISWITSEIALGEFQDVLDCPLENIDTVISLMETEDEREIQRLKHLGIYYLWSPIPVLCTEKCETYSRFHSKHLPSCEAHNSACDSCSKGSFALAKHDPFRRGLNLALDLLEKSVNNGEKVLIHCIAGMDRSPFVVAEYLVRVKNFSSLADAYSFIKSKRPQIFEHYEWR